MSRIFKKIPRPESDPPLKPAPAAASRSPESPSRFFATAAFAQNDTKNGRALSWSTPSNRDEVPHPAAVPILLSLGAGVTPGRGDGSAVSSHWQGPGPPTAGGGRTLWWGGAAPPRGALL